MNYLIPPYILQYCTHTNIDPDACEAFSLCNIIYSMTGKLYSPKDLANVAGLQNVANRHASMVVAAANKYGLLPYEYCPIPGSFSEADFYTPTKDRSKAEFLNLQIISPDITKSPLWTELEFGYTTSNPIGHMVECPDYPSTEYYDSEPGGQVKPITYNQAKVIWQASIKINNPPHNMYVETMNYQGTIGVFIPVSSPEQVPVLNNIFNVNLVVQPDGTIPTSKTVKDV